MQILTTALLAIRPLLHTAWGDGTAATARAREMRANIVLKAMLYSRASVALSQEWWTLGSYGVVSELLYHSLYLSFVLALPYLSTLSPTKISDGEYQVHAIGVVPVPREIR